MTESPTIAPRHFLTLQDFSREQLRGISTSQPS